MGIASIEYVLHAYSTLIRVAETQSCTNIHDIYSCYCFYFNYLLYFLTVENIFGYILGLTNLSFQVENAVDSAPPGTACLEMPRIGIYGKCWGPLTTPVGSSQRASGFVALFDRLYSIGSYTNSRSIPNANTTKKAIIRELFVLITKLSRSCLAYIHISQWHQVSYSLCTQRISL